MVHIAPVERVPEYQSTRVTFRYFIFHLQVHHFWYYILLYIIIYNIIIYTYKLLLSYCHFENRKCYFGTLVLWYSMFLRFVTAFTVLGTRIITTEHVSATVQHFENRFCRLVVQGMVLWSANVARACFLEMTGTRPLSHLGIMGTDFVRSKPKICYFPVKLFLFQKIFVSLQPQN